MQKTYSKQHSLGGIYSFSVVFLLCLILSVSAIWINQYAFVAYICLVTICALVYDTNKIIVISSFGAFFATCYGHNIFVVILMVALFIRCIMQFCLKKIKFKLHYLIPMAIIAILSAMLVLINFNKANLLRTFLPFILVVGFELYLLKYEIDLKYIVTKLSAMLIISCIIAAILYKLNCNVSIFSVDGLKISRFKALLPHENVLSIWCISLLSCFVALMFNNKVSYLSFWINFLSLIVIGILTMSKSFLALLFLLAIFYFILAIKRNWKTGLTQIALVLVILLMAYIIAPDKISEMASRFFGYAKNSSLLNRLTTGRFNKWKYGIKVWKSSIKTLLFGVGGSYAYNFHNSFVEVLVKYGLFGSLLTLSFVAYFAILLHNKKSKKFASYIPLIIILLYMFVEEFSTGQFITILLSIVAMYNLNINKKVHNVLYFNNMFSLGGTEVYMINVIKNLHDQFHFDVLSFSSEEMANKQNYQKLVDLGCNVYLNGKKHRILSLLNQMLFFVKHKGEYDMIHINTTSKKLGLIAYMASVYGGIDKIIYHSHMGGNCEEKHDLKEKIGDYLAKTYANTFVACSNVAAEYMFGEHFCKKNHVTILKNSIDVEKFAFNIKERQQIRKILGLENNFVILNVGRFATQKNHERLVEIFADIYNKNNNARLILVGEDNGLKSKIKKKISKLNLNNAVKILKPSGNISGLMQASDVFVLTSFHEGLPIVAVEAQASGLPVVLSSCISAETNITGNCRFINLDAPNRVWAKNILQFKDFVREDCRDNLYENGFDNNSAMQEIKKLYLNY